MSVSKANTVQARVLSEVLAAGVSHAVVSPGSRNTPILLALQEHPEIKVHVVLDERSAGFFALGLARASGSPVILSCTSGSAGAHYLPAVIEAYHSRVPLIILTSNRPHELHGVGSPQTVSQDQLFVGFLRYYQKLNIPGDGTPEAMIRTVASKALFAAQGRPNGPVHIDCPFREPLWDPTEHPNSDRNAASAIAYTRCQTEPKKEDLSNTAERLAQVQRGVLVVGPINGCRELNSATHKLASCLGWPIVAEPTSSLVSETDGLLITAADAIIRSGAFTGKFSPDLILRVGPIPTSKQVAKWAASSPCILIDEAGETLDPTHSLMRVIEGSPSKTLESLAACLTPNNKHSEWLEFWQTANSTAEVQIDRACGDGFWEGTIARSVIKSLPEAAMLHVSSSMPIRDLYSFGGARNRDLSIYSSRGANGIDGTIATALGEAHVHDEVALLMCGDLAFIHDIGSLITSKNSATGLIVLVIDNSGGGIFHSLPISQNKGAFETLFITHQNVSIRDLCSGLGINNVVVSSSSELDQALDKAFSSAKIKEELQVIVAKVSREFSVEKRQNAFSKVRSALTSGHTGGLQ